MSTDRPNLLFLLNDHQVYYRHGWDHGPRLQRPNFNQLGAEGVVFERAYTACPLCGPARRSMLTGLYPHNHGELKNDTNHPFDRETYLDLLAAGGYRNYYFGKWHAGPGTAFDHHCEGFSYPSYNNPYTKPEYKDYLKRNNLPEPEIFVERSFWGATDRQGNPRKMQAGKKYRQEDRWSNEHGSGILLTPKETHEAFFLASLARDRLRDLARNPGRPFAMRVDFWGPHQPYFVTREFADLYDPESIPEYPSFCDDLSGKPDIYRTEGNVPLNENGKLIVPNPLPWPEWQKVLARAYAHGTMVDAAGGLILEALEDLGLADNTLVIWTTDHGDALACHGGHFDKRSYMPEEMIRIPMALRWPGEAPSGRLSNALVGNFDVPPTLLAAAGLAFSERIDGASLLPLARGARTEWRSAIAVETHGHAEEHLGRAFIGQRYKYIANRGQMDELYDLALDPYEMNNRIGAAECAALAAEMRQRLDAWRQESGDRSGDLS